MAGQYKNYTLGRGELEFAQSTSAGVPPAANAAFRYLGNSPEFSLTQQSTSLDHYDSDHGVKTLDDSVILQLDRSGKFKLDSMDVENLALFFVAQQQTVTQVLGAATSEDLTPKKGYRFQLGTALTPTGVRNIANLTVKLKSAPATVYVLGTDYTADLANGVITILSGGAIADAVAITATYDVPANSRTQIMTTATTLLEGALRFRANNPKGPSYSYFFPYVQLSPDGDFAMKGDTWQEMSFSVKVLIPPTGAAMYIDGVPQVP